MTKPNVIETNNTQSTRLDKWLWAARFYKTRAIAKQMIDGGKVFYNGQRSKSGKAVVLGDRVTFRQGFEEKHVLVIALADKRRDASFAQTLYQETPESVKTREKNNLARQQGILLSPASDTKPDKKQRRQIRQLKERM
ncbi:MULTISPECIES: ribosome-associated heat shock protein Hsp15 [unclassified Colwellia]|uniref:ribosome-associated heat shock protein Hsp15 n=1 Tax=unclassified Colwellia TaxID=196834 RepID=UPI0015F60151|nr:MULTISPECIES: ribosome-associated heat shock protein Hsp15 [unclassified Colwellia]MBA6287816.1 ribosome-associated heat shock protein Hsp15 [Colwellia sp. MB3u-4]MBA6295310.1 ribosome-associated heat shock protein Hsp15 [Colwellia sp. MB02u-9]